MRSRTPKRCIRWINAASIGEIPPRTRVSPEFSAATASAASVIIWANAFHSGSISKAQCDLLLGSFQNITASIIIFETTVKVQKTISRRVTRPQHTENGRGCVALRTEEAQRFAVAV